MIRILAFLVFISVNVHCRIYFPEGSDVGYIIADPPQPVVVDSALDIPSVALENGNQLLKRQIRAQKLLQSEGSPYNNLWYPPPLIKNEKFESEKTNIKSDDIGDLLKDEKHGIKMGEANIHCDDAIHNLEVDWDFSPANYTCYTPRASLPLHYGTLEKSLETCNIPPQDYMPQHHCMNEKITYKERIPSYGDHRPLWPQFGEYKFVPPQRWLHNIEHGSVVMLYHPCTHPTLVTELGNLVKECLYKHVITPYSKLTEERPMALVAWGCTLEMSSVNATEVKTFIKNRALKGPEGIMRKQGTFTEGLVASSIVPDGKSDKDLTLCPDVE